MNSDSTEDWISDQAEKCAEKMDATFKQAVEALVADPRFVTFSDHVILLLAIAETCPSREQALALFRGAVKSIENGEMPVGRRARIEEGVGEQSKEAFAPTHQAEWSNQKNRRRCELVDKDIVSELSGPEKRELETLQREMREHRRRVAPIPLEHARRIHQGLLEELQSRKSESFK